MSKYILKKLIYPFILLISLNSICYSQSQATIVKTPIGTPITLEIMTEIDTTLKSYLDSLRREQFPNVLLIETYDGYSSTNLFNCHGYAWYMSENASPLNKYCCIEDPNEDDYMTDGSYVQVASEMHPGKVFWSGLKDHSATTYQSGVYISKWGRGPLARHDWDEQPYGTAGLKYYVSTSVSGSTAILCSSTRSFSAQNIPNASYDWYAGLGLTLNSNGNYNTSVTVNGSYYGKTHIRVEITSPLGGGVNDVKLGPELEFTIVGSNTINATNVVFTNCNSITGSLCTNCDDNEFGLPSGEYEYAEVKLTNLAGTTTYDQFYCYSQSETVDWGQYAAGTYKFWVRGINDCGTSSWSSTNLSIVDCGRSSSYYLEFTPNPVITETTVELKRHDKKEVAETIEWEFEVYDMSQIKKLKTYKFHGKKRKINTSGWKEGVYIVRAIVKDELVSGKFIKK